MTPSAMTPSAMTPSAMTPSAMTPFVRLIRVNGLQYNRNRDPQAYRRAPGETFRIQALLAGGGPVRCTLTDARGAVIAEDDAVAPGLWTHELRFAEAGTRMLRLEIVGGRSREAIDLRLDVVERDHA